MTLTKRRTPTTGLAIIQATTSIAKKVPIVHRQAAKMRTKAVKAPTMGTNWRMKITGKRII
jgi:hypothetical protein